MISQKLRVAIKLSEKRAYKIAQEADLHPSTLSKLLNGIERARRNDPRVLRVGEVLGIPENECFNEKENC